MDRKLHLVVVSVGSNIEPQHNLQGARKILASEVEFLGESEVIQTAPDGYRNQPDFLNGAYLLGTTMSYDDFNRYLKGVEERLGRVKGPIKSGPRCIDLDIIVWDGKIVHDDYRQNKHYVVNPVNELLQKHAIALT
jgi:2-amino-4-hydroxy-6-hydroxymethyldihydropteridine diphosphokinase